jgi:oligopeptide transport system substrate-binding protein
LGIRHQRITANERILFLLFRLFLPIFPIAILLSLLSCTPQFQGIPSHSSQDTFIVALSDDPSTLDWNKATDGISMEVIANLMSGLTKFDKNLHVVGNVSDNWSSNANQTAFTFHISHNSRWSDGLPVTSANFRDSFLRLLRPETASPYAYYLFDIVGATCFHEKKCPESSVGIETPAPDLLVIHLSHPMAPFPSLLTNPITDPVRMDLIRKYGDRWTDPQNLVTNGPYLLKRWVHGSLLELTRKKMPASEHSLQRILFLIIPEPVTQLLLYERHILDIAGVPSFYVKKYLHNPEFHQSLQFSTIYYSMNVLRPPFTNRHVRKAFALSIDRQDLFRLFAGAVPVSRSFIPKGLPGFNNKGGFGFHPRKAREELRLAGYPMGRGMPRITLFFPTGTQSRILAVYMQQQFKKILGVSVRLRSLEWKVFLARLDSRTPMLYQSGWMADYPDPNTFMTLMMTGSGNNRTGWSSPEFDRLVKDAVSTSDEKERKKMYLGAQEILLRQGIPVIPLAQGLTNLLVHKNVHGFWHDPLGNDHFEEVWKERHSPGNLN